MMPPRVETSDARQIRQRQPEPYPEPNKALLMSVKLPRAATNDSLARSYRSRSSPCPGKVPTQLWSARRRHPRMLEQPLLKATVPRPTPRDLLRQRRPHASARPGTAKRTGALPIDRRQRNHLLERGLQPRVQPGPTARSGVLSRCDSGDPYDPNGDICMRQALVGRQARASWRHHGSLERHDRTVRMSGNRLGLPCAMAFSEPDPQRVVAAHSLQAGGHRFDPGWLHSQTSCKSSSTLMIGNHK